MTRIIVGALLAISVGLAYVGYNESRATSAAMDIRDAAVADMKRALHAGDLDAFIAETDRFLAAADPWIRRSGNARRDPRTDEVENARAEAMDISITFAAIDGDMEKTLSFLED